MQNETIHKSLKELGRWVEQSDWKAYDTFDGLSSPYARFFTFNHPLLKRCWQQAVRRFPINLRPLLGIKPDRSTKGMGFFAQGYLRLFKTHGRAEHLKKMQFCLDWLIENRARGFQGYCWGNHFDYQARGGRIPLGTPTVVWTSLIGHAFLDAYEGVGEKRYFEVARGAAEFIINELGWTETACDLCLSYTPLPGGKPERGEDGVHNANMLGAGLLARVNTHAGKQRYLEIAEKAVHFTIRAQLENGAWYYGVNPRWHWVDSFHTGYVLEALDCYIRCKADRKFQKELERGFKFFVESFFLADGTPRYYAHKTLPIDIQCASQAIQTLLNLRELHPDSEATAIKVAEWTIANMQDKSGYFYYRKYPMITNKTPTLHWGQATMFAALALLEQHISAKETEEKVLVSVSPEKGSRKSAC